jgi:hypothetical protein
VITPRLYRRSLGHALQFRLLVLYAVGALLPALVAAMPIFRFFSRLLAHSPRARELVSSLDSHALIDVLRQLGEPQTAGALATGLGAAVLGALLFAPLLAGAALLVARADEPVRTRPLLASAGDHYGRLFRLAILGLVPLGLAAVLSGAFFRAAHHAAEGALTTSQAVRDDRLALLGTIVVTFLLQLTLDAGRAMFAAEPYRRSALFAWFSGLRLVVRRPLRSLGLGVVTLVVGAGLAFVLLLVRLRITQSGTGTVLLAFVLAQLAAASIGWHRAARLVGFAELARADAAERERRSVVAILRPPDPDAAPAAPTQAGRLETRSITLDALAPPVPVPPLPETGPAERPPPGSETVASPAAALSDPRRSGT